jgi:hypothetical protein
LGQAVDQRPSSDPLTVDEAPVFDQSLTSNIAPLFFVEVSADPEKQNVTDDDRRTAGRESRG